MRRHPLDLVSLLSGLAFLVLALAVLGGRDLLAVRWQWLWPLLLMVVGVSTMLSARTRRPEDPGDETA